MASYAHLSDGGEGFLQIMNIIRGDTVAHHPFRAAYIFRRRNQTEDADVFILCCLAFRLVYSDL